MRSNMDTSFTEEQEMLRKTARDFLATECPKAKVRELEESDKGYDPEMWKKMAGLGWMGLIIPEEYDGMGMTFQDLAIVLEEMGMNILPGPFFCTVVEGALTILDAGNEEQKKEFLPGIASGDSIWTMALLEQSGIYSASGISTKATAKNDSFVINGTKLFVEMAHIANYLICVARTKEGGSAEDEITLFIVEAKAPGVHCEIMPTMGMDKLCEVQLEDVTVPRKSILGEVNKGWPVIQKSLERAAIAKCAESVGGIQACVDMTVAYSKDRVQYDRPIGAFQALQHMMADMWIAMQTSKYLVYEAAWMESENLPCAKEVAMAKAYVNDNYREVARKAIRLHAGIGTTRDHDIPLYYRRAKVADTAFGSTDFQKEAIATKIGLIS
jgi:alkylation response protein AidB-like acyl-CoA dehydrogenase